MEKKHPIRNIFITGIVAILPLALTIYLLKLLYGIIASNLTPLSARFAVFFKVNVPEALMGIVTVVLFVVFIFLVGLLTRLYIGKLLLKLLDKIVSTIPLANTIYIAVKQMLDSFGSSTSNFRKVVMLHAVNSDNYCIGFVVRDTQEALMPTVEVPAYNVFVPTAPNPTSGFILIVPKVQCHDLPISVEEGVKFVLSVGLLNFSAPAEAEKKIKESLNDKDTT
ncbi:MAG: DUF502 domain-containing protein [Deferribacteraceae bacterium]|jgi:uncharacterized membrane protein|nr:DUF502 domain-containing protein [Deferribacteraceae bacterium]